MTAGTVYLRSAPAHDRAGARNQLPSATQKVVRGDLVAQVIVPGSVQFTGARAVTNHLTGVITWVPDANSVVRQGRKLYSVDDTPVILLHGDLPAWREFKPGMSDGEDVRMLEESLAELGYTGFTVDDEFSAQTEAAVKRWQKNTGLPQTGRIELGRVVFAPGPLRIASVQAHPGDPATNGQDVVRASGSRQRVSAQVPEEDQDMAVQGAKAAVELPDGTRIAGVVSSVGSLKNGQEGKKILPITVRLDSPRSVQKLQNADVAVVLKRTAAKNVLTVPVTALVPALGGGYAVQVVDGGTVRLVTVRTGAFANGRVEISGSGVGEGARVGVPRL
ncbi:efflux RND transporter periplasmic adaptor subunit [Streptomyces sp. NPDC001288]|uniref:efflux RND transporter periplasmic adaptor subunit n=1 Tax=unclassified Streptomyces TaxID=2593676 RepID=UPI00331E5BAD